MAKSMTGFGRAQMTLHDRDITVEVKSVNSRYFEYSSRVPRSLGYVDEPLKKAVAAKVARGKTELHLSVQTLGGGDVVVAPNLPVARGYYEALAEIARDLRIENDVKASAFTKLSDVFCLQRDEADENEVLADVLEVARAALEKYDSMRVLEGEKLVADITSRLQTLEGMVSEVEKDSEGRMQRYTDKLAERLREVLADKAVEESRLLAEAAIFADKTAVDEETVRLRSHLAQFGEILAAGGQVGRKLDFLTQEVNRETNTIGSKCQELEITRIVVDMKAEIEKIREQIQNLE